MKHSFGGDWTSEKINKVEKYLVEYTKILSKQKFRFAYIDAFAGTGYRTVENGKTDTDFLFPELLEKETQSFIDGSVKIALKIEPHFHKYFFIEKDPRKVLILEKLRDEHPLLKNEIAIINQDANTFLQDICINRKWDSNRAVLFLDPYGMQVTWDTIKAIAKTEAIDLWLLFPLGVAVNRLLKKNGKIVTSVRKRLNDMFGTEDWYDSFYQIYSAQTLFGEESGVRKTTNFDSIGKYFVSRLKEIFPGVAEKPLSLMNSKNNPLYLLCFASANPRGAKTAVKIANYILKH